MKAAILIQGEPRFCAEFDQFISNLQGYDRVDWFFYVWKTSPPTSNLVGHDGHKVVAPYWQNIDNREEAVEKIKKLLPANHRVVRFEPIDQNEVPIHQVTENYAQETIQPNVWKMWYSQHKANFMKTEQERAENIKYDVVIRTRPDVAVHGNISADYMKNRFENDKSVVLISQNKKCGYGVFITDLIGISTSENMDIYTDLYNQALEHHARGVIFHPETMLAKHLEHNGLRYESGEFSLEFRNLGHWESTATGETWPGNGVPDWNNDKIYISNFGSWL